MYGPSALTDPTHNSNNERGKREPNYLNKVGWLSLALLKPIFNLNKYLLLVMM